MRFLNLGNDKVTQTQIVDALNAVKDRQKRTWKLIADLDLIDVRLGALITAVQTYMKIILHMPALNTALRCHRLGLSFDRRSDKQLFEVNLFSTSFKKAFSFEN